MTRALIVGVALAALVALPAPARHRRRPTFQARGALTQPRATGLPPPAAVAAADAAAAPQSRRR